MRRLLPTFLVLLALPFAALAQQTTGTVTGTITDEEGNPVTGARVTFISPALQGERTAETNDKGQFAAALLPVGSYAVSISAKGLASSTYSFRVSVGQTIPLNVSLGSGGELVEEVTVFAPATPLQSTELGETFSYEESVENLPMQFRNLEQVAQFSPNVSFGPTTDRERGDVNEGGIMDLAIAGAPSFDTVVLLDGAEISDQIGRAHV